MSTRPTLRHRTEAELYWPTGREEDSDYTVEIEHGYVDFTHLDGSVSQRETVRIVRAWRYDHRGEWVPCIEEECAAIEMTHDFADWVIERLTDRACAWAEQAYERRLEGGAW